MPALTPEAQARGWLYELFAYHTGEQQRMARAAAAKGLGMNPVEFGRPYPSAVSNTTNTTNTNLQPAPAPASTASTTGNGAPGPDKSAPAPSSGLLPKLAIGGALLAGLGGGGLGLATLLKPAPPATAATSSPAIPPAPVPSQPANPAWDAIFEQQQPDGTWKQLRRQHLAPGGTAQ